MTPRAGLDASSRESYELLYFSVDGAERPIRRSTRKSGQTYTAAIGEDAVRTGKPVRINHIYRTRSGIRINAICPGIIDTHMIKRVFGDPPEGRQAVLDQEPISRMGRVEEIAAAVLWLCSDDASFALGHALVVDGGQTA